MQIDFAASERSSVGVEWEVCLVDPATGDLVQRADEVLDALGPPPADPAVGPAPHVTHELLQNTVELVSGVHRTVGGAVDDLDLLAAHTREVTDRLGIELMGAGTHPFAQWFDQLPSASDRYRRLLERTRWWGRQMLIWGIHVHVGIEERDKVLPLVNALLTYYPHLQALSASSPFWAGADTGYASNRALMFQQLPTAGLPWQVGGWANFEQYVEDLLVTGIADEVSEVRWDIRPSPKWGTIEVRACDGVATVEEIGAVAALIQCLTERLSSRLDDGEQLPMLQPWFVRENKWRAARYGLEARIITDQRGTQRPVADAIRDLTAELEPIADRLGCAPQLASVGRILEVGAGYQRQRAAAAAADGDLERVVARICHEMRHGLDAGEPPDGSARTGG